MNQPPLILIQAQLELRSDLHIGLRSPSHFGADKGLPIVRNELDGMPYIPGSSLKGRMKCLLAASRGVDNDLQPDLPLLFGTPGRRGCASFWDVHVNAGWLTERLGADLAITQFRGEVRSFAGLANRERFQLREVVCAGVHFDFRLSLQTGRTGAMESILLGLKLLEWQGIGGSTSRGMGRIKFSELKANGVSLQARLDQLDIPDGESLGHETPHS